ncbi:hypothetical protein FRC12_003412 [Ceratobasidium sp. 428]|nr:hypothetical protein FRC12_003412 [Ceratobasidium sp. 428]
MSRYNSHRRKGRSPLQKAQVRNLSHLAKLARAAKSAGGTASVGQTNGVDLEHSPKAADSEPADTSKKLIKDLTTAQRLQKNAEQREQRAKLKLSLMTKERNDAKRTIQELKKRDVSNTKEITMLRQQVDRLKQQNGQAPEAIVRPPPEMSTQRGLNEEMINPGGAYYVYSLDHYSA